MGALSYFRKIYNIDTLDTRFTTPSTVPYKTVIESRDDSAAASRERAAKWNVRTPPPSRWKTPEFYLWYLIFFPAFPAMYWVIYTASRADINTSSPRDGSRAARCNMPSMIALLIFHPLLRRLYNAVVHRVNSAKESVRPTLEEAEQRLNQRLSFDFGFAIIFLLALHGISAFKVLAIIYVNFQIATALPRKSVPVATWIFNVGILFTNDIYKGYRLGDMAAWITNSPSQPSLVGAGSALVAWGRWLDSYGGIMSRWEILFNLTVLRMISFNLDYYWSLDRRSYSPLELDPSSLSERDRITTPAPSADYSFRNFVAYAVYAPLYLTGPILTFNDYVSQCRYRPASIEGPRTVRYAVRWALCLLVMEVTLHFNYVQAIAKARPDWGLYSGAQLVLLSYFNLHVIWLKLLLPWRFFRLWALADGVDPPENMVRCVSDNYSTLSFWRSWHRSFYRWSLRYIYVPLGGSDFRGWAAAARSVATYVLVFTFVAVWHDVELRLLVWGWLIVLFMLPEMIASYLFPRRGGGDQPRPLAARLIAGLGGLFNIWMMMTANLVGFAFGVDGLKSIIVGIFGDFSGPLFVFALSTYLFAGLQIMFEVREAEKRRGIDLKC
ncbi:glycerol transporter [Diatrype stigma]|uniref:Glycerol transporter n=1 Tax=Diatrype stigma TaxID=117547 RepID=A0AAN9UN12_9PEZI